MTTAIFRQHDGSKGFELELVHNFTTMDQAYGGGNPTFSFVYNAKPGLPINVNASLFELTVQQVSNGDIITYIFTRVKQWGTVIEDGGSGREISTISIDDFGETQINYGPQAARFKLANLFFTDSERKESTSSFPNSEYVANMRGNYFDLFPGQGQAYINLRENTPKVEFTGVNFEPGVTPVVWTKIKTYAPLTYEIAASGDIFDVVTWKSNTVFGVERLHVFKPNTDGELPQFSEFNVPFIILNDLDLSKELLVRTTAKARQAYADSLDPIYKEQTGQSIVQPSNVIGGEVLPATGQFPIPAVSSIQTHHLGKIPSEEETQAASVALPKVHTQAQITAQIKRLEDAIEKEIDDVSKTTKTQLSAIQLIEQIQVANLESVDTTGNTLLPNTWTTANSVQVTLSSGNATAQEVEQSLRVNSYQNANLEVGQWINFDAEDIQQLTTTTERFNLYTVRSGGEAVSNTTLERRTQDLINNIQPTGLVSNSTNAKTSAQIIQEVANTLASTAAADNGVDPEKAVKTVTLDLLEETIKESNVIVGEIISYPNTNNEDILSFNRELEAKINDYVNVYYANN